MWLCATVVLAFVDTRLLLIRHGRTEMNEHLAQPGNEWGAAGFADPGYYDTELTSLGEQQARQLNMKLKGTPRVETLVCSPLRRALHTAELAFDGYPGAALSQRIVTPLAAERLFLSSDVGAPVAELVERFDPAWRLEVSVTDGWWYQGDPAQPEWRPAGAYLTPGEPQQAFDDRMRRLIALLQDLGGGDDDDDGTRRLGCDSAELPVDGGGIALCCHSEVIFAPRPPTRLPRSRRRTTSRVI